MRVTWRDHPRHLALFTALNPCNLRNLWMNLNVEGNTITFWLRAKPRSSRQRLTTDASGELRLEIHAAATEGQANEACVEFLARALRLPKSSISIVSGERSKRKLVRVVAPNPEQVMSQLQALAEPKK